MLSPAYLFYNRQDSTTYSCKCVFFSLTRQKRVWWLVGIVHLKEQRFSISIDCLNCLGHTCLEILQHQSRVMKMEMIHDFEYSEKWKKFVSANWTTKEDNIKTTNFKEYNSFRQQIILSKSSSPTLSVVWLTFSFTPLILKRRFFVVSGRFSLYSLCTRDRH